MASTDYMTQIQFAKIIGTTKQNVNKAIKAGKITVRKIGKTRKIVFTDTLTQLWYETQKARLASEAAIASTSAASGPITEKSSGKNTKSKETEELVSLQRQKTEEEIKRLQSDTRLKDLKFNRERGDLIEKSTQAYALWQYVDALNIAMLEFPDMVIDTIIDKVRSGASRGKIKSFMEKKIGDEIKNTKKAVKERLK